MVKFSIYTTIDKIIREFRIRKKKKFIEVLDFISNKT